MSISFLKPSVIVLAGLLGIGFLPVANAKVVWVDIKGTGGYYCPDVCKITKKFHSKHSQFNVPYAVPSGINLNATKARGTEQRLYVCASIIGGGGWRAGFNVEYSKHSCYISFRGSEIRREYFYCLCSDTPVEPIKD